jgi:prepilin-type processing-associated H-X9-DG protein
VNADEEIRFVRIDDLRPLLQRKIPVILPGHEHSKPGLLKNPLQVTRHGQGNVLFLDGLPRRTVVLTSMSRIHNDRL